VWNLGQVLWDGDTQKPVIYSGLNLIRSGEDSPAGVHIIDGGGECVFLPSAQVKAGDRFTEIMNPGGATIFFGAFVEEHGLGGEYFGILKAETEGLVPSAVAVLKEVSSTGVSISTTTGRPEIQK
jgi:hypothetical protein